MKATSALLHPRHQKRTKAQNKTKPTTNVKMKGQQASKETNNKNVKQTDKTRLTKQTKREKSLN